MQEACWPRRRQQAKNASAKRMNLERITSLIIMTHAIFNAKFLQRADSCNKFSNLQAMFFCFLMARDHRCQASKTFWQNGKHFLFWGMLMILTLCHPLIWKNFQNALSIFFFFWLPPRNFARLIDNMELLGGQSVETCAGRSWERAFAARGTYHFCRHWPPQLDIYNSRPSSLDRTLYFLPNWLCLSNTYLIGPVTRREHNDQSC